MKSQTIESTPGFPVGTTLLALGGAVLLAVAAVQGNVHYALGAVLPLALAFGAWITRPPGFRAEFGEQGLLVGASPIEIPYHSIESVTVGEASCDPYGGKIRRGPLTVIHYCGVLEIPARLNVPVVDVYRELLRRVPGSGSREVHPKLAEHLHEQEEKFGAERVWTYCARSHPGRRRSMPRGQIGSLMVMLTGFAWVFASFFVEPPPKSSVSPWLAIGILVAVMGAFAMLLFELCRYPARKARRLRHSSLIVGPIGIAMVQGDMTGQMRWDELRNVQLGTPRRSFQLSGTSSKTSGILLQVEGARIEIADVYDRPLPVIYEIIRRYWKPAP